MKTAPAIRETELHRVLMTRDEITLAEAESRIAAARWEFTENGADPEELLHSEFGLEPDYLLDFIGGGH